MCAALLPHISATGFADALSWAGCHALRGGGSAAVAGAADPVVVVAECASVTARILGSTRAGATGADARAGAGAGAGAHPGIVRLLCGCLDVGTAAIAARTGAAHAVMPAALWRRLVALCADASCALECTIRRAQAQEEAGGGDGGVSAALLTGGAARSLLAQVAMCTRLARGWVARERRRRARRNAEAARMGSVGIGGGAHDVDSSSDDGEWDVATELPKVTATAGNSDDDGDEEEDEDAAWEDMEDSERAAAGVDGDGSGGGGGGGGGGKAQLDQRFGFSVDAVAVGELGALCAGAGRAIAGLLALKGGKRLCEAAAAATTVDAPSEDAVSEGASLVRGLAGCLRAFGVSVAGVVASYELDAALAGDSAGALVAAFDSALTTPTAIAASSRALPSALAAATAAATAIRNMARLTAGRSALVSGGRSSAAAGNAARKKKKPTTAAAAAPIVELLSKACAAQQKRLGVARAAAGGGGGRTPALAGWQRWLARGADATGADADADAGDASGGGSRDTPAPTATRLLRATLELLALTTGALANLALHKVSANCLYWLAR